MPRTPAALLLAAILVAPPSAAAEPATAAPTPLDADAPVAWREPVLYSLGGMGVGLVALVASRQGDDDPSFGNFGRAFGSGPRRDDDPPLYNWVLHPLWGSETYLRAREARMGMLGSFAFSLGASLTWEYLFESWTEHPSTQDLILTTGLGWMIGELRWRWKRRHPEDAAWVDPIHTGLERLGVGVTGTSRREPKLHVSYRF
jgi:hypothetical protein